MKALLSLFLLLGLSSSVFADAHCDDLIGMWSSERYDNTLSSDRRTIKAFNADRTYWIKFIHDNGETVSTQEESGSWTCSGSVIGIDIKKIDDRSVSIYSEYNLVEQTISIHSLQPREPNCASVIGDCSANLLLKYYRVMN
jgi:hypothetical protein